MAEKVKLSKDGSSIDFAQVESLPTSVKKFRQSLEIQGFYRFVFENDLQKEVYEILERIVGVRKAKKKTEKVEAAAIASAAKKAEVSAKAETAKKASPEKIATPVVKAAKPAKKAAPVKAAKPAKKAAAIKTVKKSAAKKSAPTKAAKKAAKPAKKR
ncbi:MAG: hypothetical protein AABY53_00430 [Bdellovibrionota bacterium]